MRTLECLPPLLRASIAYDDAVELRRIAMQLHRWHELECGFDHGAIERDETTGEPYWRSAFTGHRSPVADREAGAVRRLKAVMARYPALRAYVQSDPRGASLYILRPGDVPEGENPGAYYPRGLPVYK